MAVRYSCDVTMMQRRETVQTNESRIVKGGGEAMTPPERYAQAIAELQEAEDRVRGLGERLGSFGRELNDDPLLMAPLHEAASGLLPLHITTHPFRREIDLSGWPDAREIITALGELHEARSRALALRAWMLPEDRAEAPAP